MADLKYKRNLAMLTARRYASNGAIIQAKIWIERANTFMPVTKLQIWRIKNILGPYDFAGLNLPKEILEKLK